MNLIDNLLTIRDYIRYATTSFNKAGLYFGHGTDNAYDEATQLIYHTLHLTHDVPDGIIDARLAKEEKEAILELIQKRVSKRTPLAYLTNEAWFAGMSFYVDERVLVPRSPIAELLEKQLEPWVNPEQVTQILDLCTGSGCIAITAAYAFPNATVDASDISNDALEVAHINVLRHHMEDSVTLLQSNVFDEVPAKKYDVIISNPPYVSAEEMAELPEEYRVEPALGLAAGSDGLEVVDRILAHAKDFLSDHGILIVEVGNSETALQEKYPDLTFTWLTFSRGGGGVFLLQKSDLPG